MEEELGGGQSAVEGGGHEAFGGGQARAARKVGQGSIHEAILDALAWYKQGLEKATLLSLQQLRKESSKPRDTTMYSLRHDGDHSPCEPPAEQGIVSLGIYAFSWRCPNLSKMADLPNAEAAQSQDTVAGRSNEQKLHS